jgi:CheY-like chemotaxis protein/anti-sigma regulatory factor (Ser/Thr protein kinase)
MASGFVSTGVRVLVVEDDPIGRHVLLAWLSQRGHLAVAAQSVSQARERMLSSVWDVVLTDLDLVGDGCEREGLVVLRMAGKLQPNTLKILMTAFGHQHDFSEAVRLGVDHLLIKPVSRQQLWATLDRLAELRQMQVALELAKTELVESNRRLLELRAHEQSIGALAQKFLLMACPPLSCDAVRLFVGHAAPEVVSGDLVDVASHAHGVDWAVGDAMGKGLGAAMVSAAVKLALEQERMAFPAADLLSLASRLRARVVPMLHMAHSLLTLILVRFVRKRGVLLVLDFGAPCMLIRRACHGEILFVSGTMAPLGVREESLDLLEIPLFDGDQILMVSDGVVDAWGVTDAQSSYASLVCLWRACELGAEQIFVDHLVQQGVSTAGVLDDRTAVLSVVAPSAIGRAFQVGSFVLDVSQIESVRSWLVSSLLALGHGGAAAGVEWSQSWVLQWQLGGVEMFSNLVLHAGCAQGAEVSILLSVDAHGVWVEWSYKGKKFVRPAISQDAVADKTHVRRMQTSGFGLEIIDRVFNRVSYFTHMAFSQCVLTYRRHDFSVSI